MSHRTTLLRLALVGLIGLVSLLSCTSCTTVPPKHVASLEVVAATTGYIDIQEQISCSGTVVGPHTILTAAHCFHDEVIPVTGFKFRDKPLKIVKKLEDAQDHILLYTDQTFTEIATVDLSYKPALGEQFYYWGSPESWPQIFRRCYLVAVVDNNLIMDSNVWFGDSGAGMFDQEGNIIAVVNFLTGDEAHAFRLEGSTRFAYTPAQWASMGVNVVPAIIK